MNLPLQAESPWLHCESQWLPCEPQWLRVSSKTYDVTKVKVNFLIKGQSQEIFISLFFIKHFFLGPCFTPHPKAFLSMTSDSPRYSHLIFTQWYWRHRWVTKFLLLTPIFMMLPEKPCAVYVVHPCLDLVWEHVSLCRLQTWLSGVFAETAALSLATQQCQWQHRIMTLLPCSI